jgi:hypothetical protein
MPFLPYSPRPPDKIVGLAQRRKKYMFEDRGRDAREISGTIERLLIALGIDHHDDAAMRALAEEALDQAKVQVTMEKASHGDRQALVRAELFGLAHLMMRTMEESAREDGFSITSGNEAWKAFGRALYKQGSIPPRT